MLLTVWAAGLSAVSHCRSNSSSPVQPSVLLDAVKATDDSYKVQLLSRECFDAAEGALPCPAVASQDAAVAH